MTHTVLIVIVGRMATTITTGLVRSKVNTAMSRNSLSAYVYKNNGYMVPCGDIMEQGVLPVASASGKYFYVERSESMYSCIVSYVMYTYIHWL